MRQPKEPPKKLLNQLWQNADANMLSGKKTYMTAAGGILAAVGAYFSGDMEMGTMINIVVTSLLAVFLRKGVKSDTSGSN